MRLLALSLCLGFWAGLAHAELFYVEDHGVLRQVDADPKQMSTVEWQIRLYPEGMSATGPNYWGLITGPSAANVNLQLKEQQAFEKIWRKSINPPYSTDSPFNPLGPIAIASGRKSEPDKSMDRLFEQYKSMWDDAKKDAEAALKDPNYASNPFKGIGNQTTEYGKQVADGVHRVRELRRALFQGSLVRQQVETELANAIQSLRAAQQAYGASRAGRSSSAVSRGGTCDGKPMLPGERCCVDQTDSDVFMVCAAGARCPPMPGMRCDP